MTLTASAVVSDRDLRQSLSDRYLELILLPTEQCNFRCTYCYEDFKLGRMHDDVIAGVKRLIERRIDSLELLRLSWFGGEPLAAKDIIFDITKHALSFAMDTGAKCSIRGNMTTNGYFLDLNTARQLRDVGVDTFQISLDGVGAVHNATRKRMNGGETFDNIWSNLCAIKHSDIDINIVIRMHYHPTNVNDIEQLIDFVGTTFSGDHRFKANLQTIQHKGGENDGIFPVFSWKEAQVIDSRLRDRLCKHWKLDNYENPTMCYAARANSFLIRSNGQVSKCTVAMRDDRNNIGYIDKYGALSINNEKFYNWIAGIANTSAQFAACPLSVIKKMPRS